jgi:hypothetical protein
MDLNIFFLRRIGFNILLFVTNKKLCTYYRYIPFREIQNGLLRRTLDSVPGEV